MRVLKAALCLAITTLILFAPAVFRTAAHAAALPRYAYVELGSTVYFYDENDRDKTLFAIPQTYCVEILDEQGDWYHVKYAEDNGVYRALYGYCLKSDVITTNDAPENIYLNMTISVIYRTDSVNGLLNGLEEIEVKAAYYGAYTVGGVEYSYVFANGKLGYVKYSVDNKYPKNDMPVIAPAFAENNGSDAKLITAVVITLISAAAIVILYFASKKPKLPEINN